MKSFSYLKRFALFGALMCLSLSACSIDADPSSSSDSSPSSEISTESPSSSSESSSSSSSESSSSSSSESTPTTYTITWKNGDAVLETDTNVVEGSTPTYDGATPTKASDVQYNYVFKEWSPAITSVTKDQIYQAKFTPVPVDYTIIWKNYDGTTLATENTYHYGDTPSYKGNTPQKPDDETHHYVFDGWTPEISEVEGNATFTAKFNQVDKYYTVVWKDENGVTIETDENVLYGTAPHFDGDQPTKSGDEQYSYSFSGWSPAPEPVTANIEYTATFEQVTNEYLITWLDDDNSELSSKMVPFGTIPVYDKGTPSKESTPEYTYTFTGWDSPIVPVSGPATYKATYSSTKNTYTVTWVNYNNAVLETDTNVEYGTMPSYDGDEPTRANTAQYTYTYTGWDKEIVSVTADVTYKATFSSETNKYTVIWKNYNDSVLKTDTNVEYGTMPSYSGTPTKPEDETYTYSFTGWSPAVAAVTGDAIYVAQYSSTPKSTTRTHFPDTIYFTNDYHWTNPRVYAWNDTGNNGWPGVAMTFDRNNPYGQPVYKATGLSSYTYIVINNGNSGGANQTVDIKAKDLPITDNAFYINGTGTGGKLTVGTWSETGDAIYSFKTYGQNILHCFDWSLATIKANLNDIAAQGFTAIQTSPLQPVKDYQEAGSDTNAQWWRFYQPIGLCIGNKTTNRLFSYDNGAQELSELTEAAAKKGIRVIVDVIVNHLAADSNQNNLYYQVQQFETESGIYTNQSQSLHNPGFYNHPEESVAGIVRSDSFGKDLNTASSIVQDRVYDFLCSLVDCGVTGFRFDAAKHIETKNDPDCCGSDFWENTLGKTFKYASNTYERSLWTYGEVLISNDNYRNYYQYVLDAWLYAVTAQPGWYDLPANNCVSWGESHDDYMGDQHNTTYESQQTINNWYADRASSADANILYFVRPVISGDFTGIGFEPENGWKNSYIRSVNWR